ncbi:tRNA (N6-isopentenyl adenosine(37)-C2)-methylthiotransferase MiaB, partial [candidate division WOR-3 bacterium]
MRYFLKVYGCQMNQYDGRLIEAILGAAGHCRVDSPDRADLILINTCSVREHAETRAKGYIRMLPKGKRVGILGCLAQREGIDLIEELKVDFVLGPDCYSLLPGIIESDGPIVATNLDGELYLSIRPEPVLPVTMVTVMRGCDNYCSYCIVPYVRGNARSKPLRSVVDEVRRAVGKGAKEVLLLGQDITSYRDGDAGLAQLLEEVAVVDGLRRIRFLTSHPKGVDDKLIQVMKEINSICPHIHLPLQSGSNRILRLMKRNYTIEEYYDLVARLRREIPGIGITTDLIVGFPTETVADYEATLKAVEELRF